MRPLLRTFIRATFLACALAPARPASLAAQRPAPAPAESVARDTATLARVVTAARADYRARLLGASGFYERRQRGFGHFIDAREIARLQPESVLSLLRPYLRGCTMMFVNGARAAVPPGLRVDELVAVEIYRRNLQAPAEFQNPAADCGSIALWTATPVPEGDDTVRDTP